MTHKIKNLLLAALFAVSPFAPTATAQSVESGEGSVVKVLTNRSVALTASDINFGVVDQGVIYAQADSIQLDCDTDKGRIEYGSGAPADADASFTETDGQCGEIVVESGAEGFGYRLRVALTESPTTDSTNSDPDGVERAPASLSVRPQAEGGPLYTKLQTSAGLLSRPLTIGSNAESKFDIGGSLFVGRQVSGQYVGSYSVELVVCDNNPCTPTPLP